MKRIVLLMLIIPAVLFSQTIYLNNNSVRLSPTLIDSVGLVLPDTVFCSVLTENNIYFENVSQVPDYRDYVWDVTCDSGRTEYNRWTWTPASGTEGNYTLTLTVYNRINAVVESASTVIHVSKATVTGAARRLLLIGDSITEASYYPQALKTLGGDSLVFIGTQSPETAIAREGHTGRTYSWFESDEGSPFVFSVGGHVDFTQYVSSNEFSNPDIIYILLGTNDLVGYALKTTSQIEAVAVSCDSLVSAAIEQIPGVMVVIGMTIPPSYSQDAWGNNYGNAGTRWFHKVNMLKFARALKARYGASGTLKNAQVSLHPVYVNLDTEHNMMYSETAYNTHTAQVYNKQTNGVHPSEEGYNQMADAIWGVVRSKW